MLTPALQYHEALPAMEWEVRGARGAVALGRAVGRGFGRGVAVGAGDAVAGAAGDADGRWSGPSVGVGRVGGTVAVPSTDVNMSRGSGA